MGKGLYNEEKGERVATTLRMTPDEANLVSRLREIRGLQTQQPVVHAAFHRGLLNELADEGVRLYREGMSLTEAAKRVGLTHGELFNHCVDTRVTLVDDPSFLEHTAELGRRLGIPALTKAAEHVIADSLVID